MGKLGVQLKRLSLGLCYSRYLVIRKNNGLPSTPLER